MSAAPHVTTQKKRIKRIINAVIAERRDGRSLMSNLLANGLISSNNQRNKHTTEGLIRGAMFHAMELLIKSQSVPPSIDPQPNSSSVS